MRKNLEESVKEFVDSGQLKLVDSKSHELNEEYDFADVLWDAAELAKKNNYDYVFINGDGTQVLITPAGSFREASEDTEEKLCKVEYYVSKK
ncbi:MAG: hypothetical protein KJ767_00350 [Nanoarchaeota archaeon]|nr:hypothetical protein [Nanoarchaeota archaeon]